MSGWLKLGVLASALLFAGCGGGVKEEKTDVIKISPVDIIKLTLEGIAKTGEEMGSGEESLQQAIEELGATDSAKAAALQPDFDKLFKARDPASRKTAAKNILSKL